MLCNSPPPCSHISTASSSLLFSWAVGQNPPTNDNLYLWKKLHGLLLHHHHHQREGPNSSSCSSSCAVVVVAKASCDTGGSSSSSSSSSRSRGYNCYCHCHHFSEQLQNTQKPKNPHSNLKNPVSTTSKESKFASSHQKKNIPNLFTLTLRLHHHHHHHNYHHHNLFFLFFFFFFCFWVFFFFPLQIHPNPRPNPQPLLLQIPNIRETNAKRNLPQIQPTPRPNSQSPTSVATAAIFASHYAAKPKT